MKRLVKTLLSTILAFSLCACSAGAGSISTPTSEESPSPSSTAIPESSEVSSSRGIAPDYKNSPNFLPVGSMEFTVIDNTAVPEFEGKAVEVNEDYFTSLEAKLTKEKMSKLKKEQEIQGLEISPDGKNYAYFLITYIPDENTGEVTYIDDYSEPRMVKSVQSIVECAGTTKELWRADNYLMEATFYHDLRWLGNEYLSYSNYGIYDIYNINNEVVFTIMTPEFIEKSKDFDGISSYEGLIEIYDVKKSIVPFLCRILDERGGEIYPHYYLCFYNLNEKRWLENHIHFTEFEYSQFRINWSEQTDNLLLFLQEEAIGYTYHIWSYNPITDQRVELKALQSIGDPMMVVEIRDELLIWRLMRRPEKILLYDYIHDQWICYINGLYEVGIFRKSKDLLYIEEEVSNSNSKYIGNDIYVYDLKNKIKYYYLTPRTSNN